MDTHFNILGGESDGTTGEFFTQDGGYSIRQFLPYPSQTAQRWIESSRFRSGGYYLLDCSQALFSADKNGTTYENLNIDFVTRGAGFSFSDGNGNTTTGNLTTLKPVVLTPVNKTFYFYAPSLTTNLPTSINTDSAGNITTTCEDVAFSLYYVLTGRKRNTTSSGSYYSQEWTERQCVFNQPAGYFSDSVDDYNGDFRTAVCRFTNIDGAAFGTGSSYNNLNIYSYPSFVYNQLTNFPSWGKIEGGRGFFFKSDADVVLYNYVYGTSWDSTNLPYYTGRAYIRLIFE